MMNIVTLMGRLTADPELKTTNSGLSYCRFSIAVDRDFTKQGEEKQTDFINCVAWDKRAEFISRYFSKGSLIALKGSIRTGSYTDNSGNKRYTTDVVIDNVYFTGEKKDSGSSYSRGSRQTSESNSSYRQDPAPAPSYSSGSDNDFDTINTDEDLPF